MTTLQQHHYHITLLSTFGILGWVYWIGVDPILQQIIMFYFILDLFFFSSLLKPDMVLHHVVSLFLTMFCYQPYRVETKTLVLMEVSTPFLILCRLHVCQNVNRLLFVGSYVYFRIWKFGWLLFQHRYEVKNYKVWLSFVLYCLNCYWMEIIVRTHLFSTMMIQEKLISLVPYSHGSSSLVFLLFLKQYNLLGMTSFMSSLASYWWHCYKTLNFYLWDLVCFHLLSFLVQWKHVPSSQYYWKILSVPFHFMDVMFYYSHRPLWLLLSVGYDVLLVFFSYQHDFVWLLGWLLVFLMLIRQTFGVGSTQTIIHLLIAYLFSCLGK